MVAGFLLYAPRRSTIFEAHEQEGVVGMSTVALRSSSGWSYPVLSAGALAGALAVHRPPNLGDGKGHKDRVTMLPAAVKAALTVHLEGACEQHQADLRHGAGWVELPGGLLRKYPNAGREWGWQWVFPATRLYVEPVTGQRRRHHLHGSLLQRAVKDAVRAARIAKPATCHTLRHRPGASWPPGREHDDDLHPRPQPGPGRGPEPRRPDVPVMSLALQQRYQISERDIPQRLAVYDGTRGGGLCRVAGIHASPCRVGLIGRDIQNCTVG